MSSGFLCIEHCNKRIFYLHMPNNCARCQQPLDQLNVMPFRIASPFIPATDVTGAIVIRPTTGSFSLDYNRQADLHIGLTTTTGQLIEYDQRGLRYHSPDNTWNESLVVKQMPEHWHEKWDRNIEQICETERHLWSADKYNCETNNCFTFVLAALRHLDSDLFADHIRSKLEFCQHFIYPKLLKAMNYVRIYRKVSKSEYFVDDDDDYTTIK